MELEQIIKKTPGETFLSAATMDTEKTSKDYSASLIKPSVKKSKLSFQMNLIQSYNIPSDECKNSINKEEYEAIQNFALDVEQKMGVVTRTANNIRIKINFLCVIEEKDALFSMNFYLPGEMTISELIKLSITKFNDEEFETSSEFKKHYLLSLKESYKDYEMKPSKKNNYPNMDLPSLCKYAMVYDTQISNFSLIIKKDNIVSIQTPRQGCLVCKSWKSFCSVF